MNYYLLDVVDAGVSDKFDWTLIIVLSVTILIETLVMWVLKYNLFKKSLLDSLLVNIASIAVGYGLLAIAPSFFNSYAIVGLIKLLVITIAVEFGVLYLLNRSKPVPKTFTTAVVINVTTYFFFYLFIHFSGR